jgi:hypothetical protein
MLVQSPRIVRRQKAAGEQIEGTSAFARPASGTRTASAPKFRSARIRSCSLSLSAGTPATLSGKARPSPR